MNTKVLVTICVISVVAIGVFGTLKKKDENQDVNQQQIKQFEKKHNVGDQLLITIMGVEYPFRWCPAGTFMMGSPESERWRDDNEIQHQVTLTHGFWMLETEVMQNMWVSVMNSNPSRFKGNNLPLENVSWNDCQEFIQRINGLDVVPPGYQFSLPTEAQWEYACRAGTTTPFHFGDVVHNGMVKPNANYGRGYIFVDLEFNPKPLPSSADDLFQEVGCTTTPGSYPANAWGLYDMHGNVSEWCLNWCADYPTGSVTDPQAALTGQCHIFRGGSWCEPSQACRSASRSSNGTWCRLMQEYFGLTTITNGEFGFRLAIVPKVSLEQK